MGFRWSKQVETVEVAIPTCDRCGGDLPVLPKQQRSAERTYDGVVLEFVPSAWPNGRNARVERSGDREDRLEVTGARLGRAVDLCPSCADAVYESLVAASHRELDEFRSWIEARGEQLVGRQTEIAVAVLALVDRETGSALGRGAGKRWIFERLALYLTDRADALLPS